MGLGAGAVSWLSARFRRAAALVRVSADCARCRKLAAQAAYILVPASRMSTGCGILPIAAIAIWVYGGVIAQIAKLWGSYFK